MYNGTHVVQPIGHTLNKGNRGVLIMTYRNIVIINDKEVDIKELTEEERKRLAEFWNRRAANAIGYQEVKSPKKIC